MSEDRHNDLPRQFRGEARIDRPVLERGPLPPYHATVKVVPVHLRRGVLFQVQTAWDGPPADYMPADPRPGHRQDIYSTGDLELAKAVAEHAASQLGRGVIPDLRTVAQLLTDRLARGPYG